jgi:hypothetical protein
MQKLNLKNCVLALLVLLGAQACSKKVKVADNPLKTIVLKVSQKSGFNGASVAYNPNSKLYYVALAGNKEYPLEAFDENGNNVYKGMTHFDVRGMWWNKDNATLEGNGYNDFGVAVYKLNTSGYPDTKPETATKQSLQPDAQSAGAYDYKNKHIIYYNNGELVKVKRSDFSQVDKVQLALPVSKDYINETTVIYTGVAGKEVGLLDYENKKVYLFDIKTGKLTHTVNLPADVVTHSMFRFSFANGYIWLYDTDTRSWTGYKLY